MNQVETINKLKELYNADEAARALFGVWAKRSRTRTTVTTGAIAQTMKLEGFNYPRSVYAEILRFLNVIGLGTVMYSIRGKVAALTEVKATLQSIGAVAMGTAPALSYRRYRGLGGIRAASSPPKAIPIPFTIKPPTMKPKVFAPAADKEMLDVMWKESDKVQQKKLTLSFQMKDKTFVLELPRNCTGEEIADLVNKLQHVEKGSAP